jgi:hypothetical protein
MIELAHHGALKRSPPNISPESARFGGGANLQGNESVNSL